MRRVPDRSAFLTEAVFAVDHWWFLWRQTESEFAVAITRSKYMHVTLKPRLPAFIPDPVVRGLAVAGNNLPQ